MTHQELRLREVELAKASAELTRQYYNDDPFNEAGDSPAWEDVEFNNRCYEQAQAEYERDFS